MADNNTLGEDEAPGSRRSTKKAAAKRATPPKKVAPRKTGAAKAPKKAAAAKKARAPRKVAPTKKAAPAKQARATKKAAAVMVLDETVAADPIAEAPPEAPPEAAPDDTTVTEPQVAPRGRTTPPPPPSAAPPVTGPGEKTKRKGKKGLVLLLVVLAVALIAGGAVLVANLISSDDKGVGYTSLKPGDCFNNPPDNFKRVTKMACTRAHDLEVVAVVEDPSPKKAPYPGTAALVQTASERCAPAFQAYVGVPVEQSQLRQVEVVPQKASWDDGGRHLVCTVRSPDGAPTTSSARGSNR